VSTGITTSTGTGTSGVAGPTLSFSGIGTGIDTASIVDALMKIERQPITRIQNDKADLQTKQGVVQEINNLVGTLRDAAASMYRIGALGGKTGTAADPTIVSAAVGSSTANGTYNIVVSALAQSHTLASVASPVLTAGQSLDIATADGSVNVAVQDGDSLQALADRINGTEGVGVSASVVNDKLVMISRQSGTAGAVTVGGSAAAALGMATTQAGQDAAATVNGLAVTSSGNAIDGAIAGATLTLSKVGMTTLTVSNDATSSNAAAQAFVDAYNGLMGNIRKATAYDADTKQAGTLQGDQTMTGLAGQLRGIAGSAVAGMTGAYNSLATIGITAARDGTLSLDTGVFQKALGADPDAVNRIFGNSAGDDGTGAANGIARQIQAFSSNYSSNILSSRLTGFTSQLARMDDRIASLQQVMDLREQTLKAQFAAMEQAVTQFQSQGNDLSAQLAKL
jgi:flagellar hook-associated protein 2